MATTRVPLEAPDHWVLRTSNGAKRWETLCHRAEIAGYMSALSGDHPPHWDSVMEDLARMGTEAAASPTQVADAAHALGAIRSRADLSVPGRVSEDQALDLILAATVADLG